MKMCLVNWQLVYKKIFENKNSENAFGWLSENIKKKI